MGGLGALFEADRELQDRGGLDGEDLAKLAGLGNPGGGVARQIGRRGGSVGHAQHVQIGAGGVVGRIIEQDELLLGILLGQVLNERFHVPCAGDDHVIVAVRSIGDRGLPAAAIGAGLDDRRLDRQLRLSLFHSGGGAVEEALVAEIAMEDQGDLQRVSLAVGLGLGGAHCDDREGRSAQREGVESASIKHVGLHFRLPLRVEFELPMNCVEI